MPMNAIYQGPGDLPDVIPVFPLAGALLLPRGQMPLNIFEPRYLAMIDDALRSGQRLIGMIQPDTRGGIGRASEALQDRLRRAHHPVRRKRRRPLSDPAHRRRPLPRRGGAHGGDALPAMPRVICTVRRRLHPAQGRGRGRSQSTPACARRFPQSQQSQGRLGRHRKRAERGAGQRAGDDVALWQLPRSRRCWRRPISRPGRRSWSPSPRSSWPRRPPAARRRCSRPARCLHHVPIRP